MENETSWSAYVLEYGVHALLGRIKATAYLRCTRGTAIVNEELGVSRKTLAFETAKMVLR